MAATRRAYTGGAVSTTTTSAINASGTTSFTITAYTGWPYGTDPFYIVVEPGTASEEKMLVTRAGATDNTISIASDSVRGLDGTAAVSHGSGVTTFPVFTSVDADEANELASKWTTKGDLVSYGSSTFEKLAVGSNGALLMADSGATSGLKWTQPGYTYVQTVYFTSNGTFTKATYPWLRAARVKVQGAGGAGGGAQVTSSTQVSSGGGGGGGGFAEEFITDIAGMAASVTVTVGAGGAGVTNANGGNGGASSFGSYATGNGGVGGDVGVADVPSGMNAPGGAGGTASGGDINWTGQAGQRALTVINAVGRVLSGDGGSCMLGQGARAVYTASGIPGINGENYGGGGSGAANDNNNASTRAGGDGAGGIVIVELFA